MILYKYMGTVFSKIYLFYTYSRIQGARWVGYITEKNTGFGVCECGQVPIWCWLVCYECNLKEILQPRFEIMTEQNHLQVMKTYVVFEIQWGLMLSYYFSQINKKERYTHCYLRSLKKINGRYLDRSDIIAEWVRYHRI